MKVTLSPSIPEGSVKAIASKSVAHRSLICAAFAEKPTKIFCEETNKDIEATAGCLSALGADIKREGDHYTVCPISKPRRHATLDCNESGSTLRFLLPIAAALGADADFLMAGRLPQRPLSPLREELEAHGISFSPAGSNPLSVRGVLDGGDITIAGNVSSQFISGLLFALTVSKRSAKLKIEGSIESAPYIKMTEDALELFSVRPSLEGNVYTPASSPIISPSEIWVEGDWSNAAFPMAAGALSPKGVTVTGLNPRSSQGDKAIAELLCRFGASVTQKDGSYTVRRKTLRGIDIDASQIPDLVPILATVASVAEGKTRIYGAARLRIKESDRLMSTRAMLSALGADIRELEDGLEIIGKPCLEGGCVSSFNDHRIAMSAAVASAVCRGEVTVNGAEATDKSYPTFWQAMDSLNFSLGIS